jgi:hypothetical protein
MPFNYATSRWQVYRQGTFTENATSLTHTLTFSIPAGSTLMDILITPVVLWGATTSATLNVGDANSNVGWFTGVNLKATDLILGERLQASNGSYWGGKQGLYLNSTTGTFGRPSGTMIGGYCPTATSVIGVVTVVGPSATVGRTVMTVVYARGKTVAPVLA